jgi:hypothetical protein
VGGCAPLATPLRYVAILPYIAFGEGLRSREGARKSLHVALFASSEADGSEEDAEGDRQDSAMAQKGARAAGYRNGGEGHETPGGQLHTREVSGVIQARGRRQMLRVGNFTTLH